MDVAFTVAERVLYVPSIGYCLLLALIFQRLLPGETLPPTENVDIAKISPSSSSSTTVRRLVVVGIAVLIISAYSVRLGSISSIILFCWLIWSFLTINRLFFGTKPLLMASSDEEKNILDWIHVICHWKCLNINLCSKVSCILFTLNRNGLYMKLGMIMPSWRRRQDDAIFKLYQIKARNRFFFWD